MLHALLLQPEYDAIVSTQEYCLAEEIFLGDTFSFEYYWEMGVEPTGPNFDFLLFSGTEWETFCWALNFNSTSEAWQTDLLQNDIGVSWLLFSPLTSS